MDFGWMKEPRFDASSLVSPADKVWEKAGGRARLVERAHS